MLLRPKIKRQSWEKNNFEMSYKLNEVTLVPSSLEESWKLDDLGGGARECPAGMPENAFIILQIHVTGLFVVVLRWIKYNKW